MTYNPDDYFPVRTAEDVTEDVIEGAWGIIEGWYMDTPIDWEDVWDRLESTPLRGWAKPDLGGTIGTPAMKKIQREMKKRKREASA